MTNEKQNQDQETKETKCKCEFCGREVEEKDYVLHIRLRHREEL